MAYKEFNTKLRKCCFGRSKDENIGNNGYIGTSILRIYRIYRRYIGYIEDISTNILEKNIGRLKIVKKSWKCKENLIII